MMAAERAFAAEAAFVKVAESGKVSWSAVTAAIAKSEIGQRRPSI